MALAFFRTHEREPARWAAVEDAYHVGYGATREEAEADLARLLREKAEYHEVGTPAARTGRDGVPDAVLIECMIDHHGISWMLATISEICGEKAEHIATAWQDAHLAKRWATLQGAVGVIVPKAVGL
jgi:hypothetical protein